MNARLSGAISACVIAIVSQSALAVPVSGQGTWETTLQGRDLGCSQHLGRQSECQWGDRLALADHGGYRTVRL